MCQTGGIQADALVFCCRETEAQHFLSEKQKDSLPIKQSKLTELLCSIPSLYTHTHRHGQIRGNNVMSNKT